MTASIQDKSKTIAYAKSLLEGDGQNAGIDRIEVKIAEIKSLVGEAISEVSGKLPLALAKAQQALISQGLEEQFATALIQSSCVSEEMSTEELKQGLVRVLLSNLPDTAPPPRRSDTKPTIIALVGPTGVGKTTTIAKLATKYRLQQGRRVTLVTADTYRVAAVDQLKQYADLFDATLEIAGTTSQMEETISNLPDSDIVLIDTAGRSAIDSERIEETARILSVANPDEIHLVLSATTSTTSTRRAAESFSATKYDRIIVTKLDEAATYGQIVTSLCELGIPVSWFTDGQDISSHLEIAKSSRIVTPLFDCL